MTDERIKAIARGLTDEQWDAVMGWPSGVISVNGFGGLEGDNIEPLLAHVRELAAARIFSQRRILRGAPAPFASERAGTMQRLENLGLIAIDVRDYDTTALGRAVLRILGAEQVTSPQGKGTTDG